MDEALDDGRTDDAGRQLHDEETESEGRSRPVAAAAALTFETERSSDCVNVCDAVAPRRRVSKVNLLLLATLRRN